MNYFFADAETDGLYGSFLSAAVLVTDEKGIELEHFYGAVQPAGINICSQWVRENVLPYIKDAENFYESEYDLLEAVWSFWMKYRGTAFAVADIMHPVESRLFTVCVNHDPKVREYQAPFPLLDLSTLLIARKLPWDADRNKLSGLSLRKHNALNDVRMTAAVWFNIL